METITTKNMEIGLTAEELQTLWHACFILSDLRKTLENQQAHGLQGWKDFKFSYDEILKASGTLTCIACSADNDIFKVF